MKMFELSKFQVFVNKRFKTTLNIAIQSLSVIHFDNFLRSQETFTHRKCERNDW